LFYCPNGHGQHYTAKSDREKLSSALAELDQTNAKLKDKERALANLKKAHQAELRKLHTQQSVTQCPCCTRTFTPIGMRRHLSTKHPEWKP
jgi:hypothetical protein